MFVRKEGFMNSYNCKKNTVYIKINKTSYHLKKLIIFLGKLIELFVNPFLFIHIVTLSNPRSELSEWVLINVMAIDEQLPPVGGQHPRELFQQRAFTRAYTTDDGQ